MAVDAARQETKAAGVNLLEVKVVGGDHLSSLRLAVQGYLQILNAEG